MSRIGEILHDGSGYVRAILQAASVVIGKVRLVTATGDEITDDTLDAVKAVLQASDGTDIGDVDVATISGVAPQMDDTDKLAVSLYGKASAAGDTALLADQQDNLYVAIRGDNSTQGTTILSSASDNQSNSNNPLITAAWGCMFNEIGWDRVRGNVELTLLASAARTATTNTSDQTNYNHRGLILFVDVTARSAATTLTPSLQVREIVGSNYITVWTAAAAINSGDATVAYLFYPSGLADAAELYTEAVDITIGRTWRVVMTHSDTDSITYSVSAAMIL